MNKINKISNFDNKKLEYKWLNPQLIVLSAIFFTAIVVFAWNKYTNKTTTIATPSAAKILVDQYLEGSKVCNFSMFIKAKNNVLFKDGTVPVPQDSEQEAEFKKSCGKIEKYTFIRNIKLYESERSEAIGFDYSVLSEDSAQVGRIIATGNENDGYLLAGAPGFPMNDEQYIKFINR